MVRRANTADRMICDRDPGGEKMTTTHRLVADLLDAVDSTEGEYSEPVCYVVNNIAAGNRIHFLHSSMVAYGERWG